MSPEPHRDRKPIKITMAPEIRAKAEELAAEQGLPLSRYIERLIRLEIARREQAQFRRSPDLFDVMTDAAVDSEMGNDMVNQALQRRSAPKPPRVPKASKVTLKKKGGR